jgi:hypothetical protein
VGKREPSLSGRTRFSLGAVGVVLFLLGVATWILPVAIDQGQLVKREVTTQHRREGVAEEFVGWGSLHSPEVAIALLGTGFVLFLLGILPAGSVKSLNSPLGGLEFESRVVSEVIDATAGKVPQAELKDVVPRVLTELGRESLQPSRSEIEEMIDRVLERDQGRPERE